MEKPEDPHSLQLGKNLAGLARDETDEIVTLLPELCYSINRVLEDCTPAFSKKIGVALWALGVSTKMDPVGPFLTTSDLVSTFRDWFVVSEASANSEISKVKADLFSLRFIKIEGDKDNIHLTLQGEEALRQMYQKAKTIVGNTIVVLNSDERKTLIDFARRMIATKRKPMAKEGAPDESGKNLASAKIASQH